ncbi:MAG: hypothetical protein H6748_04610 [Spirochaetaceae bacterium]|nr:hypothetical protein [Myxococcales bacterium]MCB9723313.1 hypothetical protein [Spirochaetaceae bacterium]
MPRSGDAFVNEERMPRSGDALVNEERMPRSGRDPARPSRTARARTARAWRGRGSSRRLALVSALALGLFASSAAGDTAGVGEVLSPIALEDQHGVLHQIDDSTRVVLFSRDMDGGRLLKAALAEVPASALTERGAVYVSDISGMPRPVATLFALPGMRRRPYPMLLDRDGEVTRVLPDVEGRATLLFLVGLRITRVEHVDSAEAVREALGLKTDATD